MGKWSQAILKRNKEIRQQKQKIEELTAGVRPANNSTKGKKLVVDENGAYIFRAVKTADRIPAGEYLPARHQLSDSDKRITSLDEQYELNDTRFDQDEDPITELQRALGDIPEYNGSLEDSENSFIPVHHYFPMEDYNKGLQSAKDNITSFLNAKDTYRNLDMDYRRGVLLYGDPETGKSQFIYQLSRELIQDWNAIVLRVEGTRALDTFYEHVMTPVAAYQNRLKVVVIEELADLCMSRGNVSMLLSMLDSMIFRENVLFLITTNYPGKIHANIVDRPARLDLLCSIYTSDFKSDFVDHWFEFCMKRPIADEERSQNWYNETKGKLSPAYYKELFIFSRLHQMSLEDVWQRIQERKRDIKNNFDRPSEGIGFGFV